MIKKLQYGCLLSLIVYLCACTSSHSTTLSSSPNSMANILKYPFTVKTVKLVSGIEIAYAEQGKGGNTPLLFIHGLGSYMRAWDKNIAELSKSRRCIRLDLPNYGKSSKGKYPAGMKFFADNIKAFCDRLGLRKVIIVGHSMGGQIATTMALKYPNLIEKMILVDPAGFETFTDVQKTTLKNFATPEVIKSTTEGQIQQNFKSNFYKMPSDVQFMIDDRIKMRSATDFEEYCYGVSQNIYGMLDEPVFTKLSTISTQTLCFYGKNDALIPNKFLNPTLNTEGVAKAGSTKMPNCQLIMLNEAGHFAMWEQAKIVNSEIAKFLNP